MAKTYTILGYADALKHMTKDLNKAILPPFRKGQKMMRDALIAEYWKHDLGAKIWKWRQDRFNLGGGPAVKLGTGRRPKYPRWSQSNQAYVAPISVMGMAAKIEIGGRLRRHSFWGRASESPGAVLRRRPVLDNILERNWDRTVDDISRSFGIFIETKL